MAHQQKHIQIQNMHDQLQQSMSKIDKSMKISHTPQLPLLSKFTVLLLLLTLFSQTTSKPLKIEPFFQFVPQLPRQYSITYQNIFQKFGGRDSRINKLYWDPFQDILSQISAKEKNCSCGVGQWQDFKDINYKTRPGRNFETEIQKKMTINEKQKTTVQASTLIPLQPVIQKKNKQNSVQRPWYEKFEHKTEYQEPNQQANKDNINLRDDRAKEQQNNQKLTYKNEQIKPEDKYKKADDVIQLDLVEKKDKQQKQTQQNKVDQQLSKQYIIIKNPQAQKRDKLEQPPKINPTTSKQNQNQNQNLNMLQTSKKDIYQFEIKKKDNSSPNPIMSPKQNRNQKRQQINWRQSFIILLIIIIGYAVYHIISERYNNPYRFTPFQANMDRSQSIGLFQHGDDMGKEEK